MKCWAHAGPIRTGQPSPAPLRAPPPTPFLPHNPSAATSTGFPPQDPLHLSGTRSTTKRKTPQKKAQTRGKHTTKRKHMVDHSPCGAAATCPAEARRTRWIGWKQPLRVCPSPSQPAALGLAPSAFFRLRRPLPPRTQEVPCLLLLSSRPTRTRREKGASMPQLFGSPPVAAWC